MEGSLNAKQSSLYFGICEMSSSKDYHTQWPFRLESLALSCIHSGLEGGASTVPNTRHLTGVQAASQFRVTVDIGTKQAVLHCWFTPLSPAVTGNNTQVL